MNTVLQLFNKIQSDVGAVERCITCEDHNMLHYHTPKLKEYINMFLNLYQGLERLQSRTIVLNVIVILSELCEAADRILSSSEIISNHNLAPHTKFSGRAGRPKIIIPPGILHSLKETGLSWSKIAKTFNVSCRTLKRLRSFYNIEDNAHPEISDEELDRLIFEVKKDHPHAGYVYVWSTLKAMNCYVTWKRLKERMRRIDPVGIHLRLRRRLKRRKYMVKGANYLWHMDGNEKLVAWHYYIHGCIDGHSHKIIYLKLAHDKKADTVFNAFLKGAETDGLPLRVRGDGGTENNMVKDYMLEVMAEVKNAFIVGRSVHNERIERLWGEVNRVATRKFKDLFLKLQSLSMLDGNSLMDLLCLSYIYYPRINKSLQTFKITWNAHGLRTEARRTPNQIWTISILNQLQKKGTLRNLELDENHCIKSLPLLPSDTDDERESDLEESQIFQENFDSLCRESPGISSQFLEIARHIVPNPLSDDNADGVVLYLSLREHFQTSE